MNCSRLHPYALLACAPALLVMGVSVPGQERKEQTQPRPKVVKEKGDAVVLGPLLLADVYEDMADLYEKMPDQGLREITYAKLRREWDARGLKHSEVVQALRDCEIFIVDWTRTDDQTARLRFFDALKPPLLLMRGKSAFDFKDISGGQVTIAVTSISLTYPVKTMLEGSDGGHRHSGVRVQLKVIWTDTKKMRDQKEYLFCSEELVWTPTNIVDPKKEKGKKT
jgi:hypothetical protein